MQSSLQRPHFVDGALTFRAAPCRNTRWRSRRTCSRQVAVARTGRSARSSCMCAADLVFWRPICCVKSNLGVLLACHCTRRYILQFNAIQISWSRKIDVNLLCDCQGSSKSEPFNLVAASQSSRTCSTPVAFALDKWDAFTGCRMLQNVADILPSFSEHKHDWEILREPSRNHGSIDHRYAQMHRSRGKRP